ncbi:MAG TPA: hypothetical protein VFA26_18525 [Gemmataceae bacterium]|nr:hypothetical protein [Gemmataceae bacterium]
MSDKTLLVLVPVDCRPSRSARTRRVIAALRARGWSPVTLGDVVPKRHRRTLVAEDLVGRAIRQAGRVVVLPRPDGSIGRGTVRDIRLAVSLRVPVTVFGPNGRSLPVERAGLVVAGEDPRFAGRFRCYEQAPSETPA